MASLEGQVAVVAGATRGAGRGIAVSLGEAGATVYCTGRSVRGKRSAMDRPETIEETAEMVTAAGGEGIHVRVDHTEEAEVSFLFEKVNSEQGRLDILVNDVWGGDPLIEFTKKFWEQDLKKGFQVLKQGVDAHIITSRYGVPMMIEQDSGLIIEITDGDDVMNRNYRAPIFYDIAKITPMRLAFGMAQEIGKTGVTALCLTPGFLRSEAMLDHFGVKEENWRDAIEQDEHFVVSETPYYIGRAVAALACDPNVKKKAGLPLSSWDLAKEYGFTDLDGSRPDWGTYMRENFPELVEGP